MTRRKPRGLTDEERALWQRVRESAVPLRPDAPHPLDNLPEAVESKRKPKEKPQEPVEPFRVGDRAETALGHDLAPQIRDSLAAEPVRMDRKRFGRMKKGKLVPEARLDLHGMTLAEAHPALTRFILNCHAEGKRLVLVITGKGKTREDDGPMPVRRGVLRNQVPQWLRMGPLRGAVLQISEAHVRHGGEGAYYVYLRRPR